MRTFVASVLIFIGFGLFGPLLRWATWPPVMTPFQDFIYELVLLLWPTQPLAMWEASIGSAAAGALAVGANVLLWGVLGAVVGLIAKRPATVWGVYPVFCAVMFLFLVWITGSSLRVADVYALVVAFFLYALPFLALSRFTNNA